MKRYICYSPDTGEIIRRSVRSDDDPAPEKEGTVTLEVDELPPKNGYVKNGVIKVRPPAPGDSYYWDTDKEQWVVDVALKRSYIRQKRARYLQASDWTQLPDVPLESRAAWAEYRQALRDVPEQPGFPVNVEWPVPPE